jgi:glutaredoxin-related protein
MRERNIIVKGQYINKKCKITLNCGKEGHHDWNAIVYNVLNGSGCLCCANKCSECSEDKFIKIVRENGWMLLSKYIDNNTKVILKCKNPHHHEWESTPHSIKGSETYCHCCSGHCNICPYEKFIGIVNEKGGILKGKYIDVMTPVTLNCGLPDHHDWPAKPVTVNYGAWCHCCANRCDKCPYEKFMRIITEKKGIMKSEYVNVSIPVTLNCGLPGHHDWTTMPSTINTGKWCSCCSRQCVKCSESLFIDIIKEKGGIVKGSYQGTHIRVEVECDKGHIFKASPNKTKFRGDWCPHCSFTRGYSISQINWLESIERKSATKIRKATDPEGEFYIDTVGKVDGYHIETNTVYEYHGCYWHGCNKCFSEDGVNKTVDKPFGLLREKTLERDKRILELGYNLVVKWECDDIED